MRLELLHKVVVEVRLRSDCSSCSSECDRNGSCVCSEASDESEEQELDEGESG